MIKTDEWIKLFKKTTIPPEYQAEVSKQNVAAITVIYVAACIGFISNTIINQYALNAQLIDLHPMNNNSPAIWIVYGVVLLGIALSPLLIGKRLAISNRLYENAASLIIFVSVATDSYFALGNTSTLSARSIVVMALHIALVTLSVNRLLWMTSASIMVFVALVFASSDALTLSSLNYLRFPIILLVFVLIAVYLYTKRSEAYVAQSHLSTRTQELESISKELESANSALRTLSMTDALTGLPNRRTFDATLESEWLRATRERTELSVLMIDIDYFKRLNDSLGHQAGDLALQKVSQELKDSLRRPADFVARYGGEEFAIVLPNTNKEGCMIVAEFVRSKIEALQLVNPGSTMQVVTISIGVHLMQPSEKYQKANLIGLADEALYIAKSTGRNKVVLYKDDELN